MAKKLKDLVITKVALVPKGSNPDADITLFKGDEPVEKITFDEVIAGHPEGTREALWKIYDACYAMNSTVYANMYGGKNVVADMKKSLDQFTAACLTALDEASITKATKASADAIQAAVIVKAREFLAKHQEATVAGEITNKKREDMTKEELLVEVARIEKAAAPAQDVPPAEVIKAADLPEPVKKAFEALTERVAKAETEAQEAKNTAAVEKAARELGEMTVFVNKELSHLPGKAEDIAKGLVESKSKLSKESYDLMITTMKAGSAAIEKAGEESGTGDGLAATGSAFEKLSAIGEELRKTETKLTKEQAFAKAVDQNPELWKEHRAEQKAVN